MTSVNDQGRSTVFTYRRLGGDERNVGQYSVGIGGHVEKQDDHHGSPVLNCAYREIAEELKIPEGHVIDITPDPIDILFFHDREIDRVHVGLVFAAEIYDRSTNIVLQNLESNEPNTLEGKTYTGPELREMLASSNFEFEPWSRHVIEMMRDVQTT